MTSSFISGENRIHMCLITALAGIGHDFALVQLQLNALKQFIIEKSRSIISNIALYTVDHRSRKNLSGRDIMRTAAHTYSLILDAEGKIHALSLDPYLICSLH